MRRPIRSFSIAFLLLGALLWLRPGAAAPPPLTDYFRDTWRTVDGLPHNLVNSIAQTPDGYMWFATWEGVARFNGREFTVFDRQRLPELSDAGVRSLHVAGDGALWIGGSRGSLARYLGGRWQFFDPAASLINDLTDDALGQLWIGTESNGLERLQRDGSRRRFGINDGLPSNGVHSLLEIAPGRMLVGTSRGLALIEDDRVAALPLTGEVPQARVFALHRATDDSVLIGTEQGLFTLRGQHIERVMVFPAGESVMRINIDRDGLIWVGTVDNGLYRLSGNAAERFDAHQGLPNNRVVALLSDLNGHMWAGTSGGLVRFRNAPFNRYTSEHGLSDDYVRTLMTRFDGSLWVGTSNGLSRQTEAGDFVPIDGEADFPGRSILSLAEGSHGDVWIGTYANGVLHWRDGKVVQNLTRQSGLGADEIRSLLAHPDGSLWIGTAHGLSRLDANGVHTLHREDGLPGEFIAALLRSRDGRIWIGTGSGLAYMDDSGVHAVPLAGEASEVEFIFGFHEADDGSLWMATDRGLLRLRNGESRLLGRTQGMPLDKVFNVVEDQVGNFWLGSNRGVLRVSVAEANAVADGELDRALISHYAEADGMASSQCNGGSGPSAVLHDDGSVLFATALGVASVQPATLSEFQTSDPPVVIERFRVDGKDLLPSDRMLLPPGTQRLELSYAGLGYVIPERIQYQYRLDGFDTRWVDRGPQLSAEFTNLQPGDYRFRVRAAYPGGNWGGREAGFGFSISPLLWQRPLFWWLSAAIALSIVVVIYRGRVRRLKLGQQRLRELVDMRTADLRLQTERLQAADVEKSDLLAQLRLQSDAFERQAREDALTGLANRRAFDEALAEEVSRAERSGNPLCLALIDIDLFKRINDNWSHAVGDAVLKRLADELTLKCRTIDSVARWGGEEFAVLLPYTTLELARAVCERLRSSIERIVCSDIAPGLHITVSVGIASHQLAAHHEKLVSLADEALYRAKQAGRNRVCV